MDELMNSMKDTILSLTDGLEVLGKECYMAGENYKHQNELPLLVSEFVNLTTSSDYESKHELLMSECRKLTHSFRMITQHVWELTVALRYNEVETGNMPGFSLDVPLPEWAGALCINAVQTEAIQVNAVQRLQTEAIHVNAVQTEERNMAASPASPFPEVAGEHNRAAPDETVLHNTAALHPGSA